MTWEVTHGYYTKNAPNEELKELLAEGWEPFGGSAPLRGPGIVWLRRLNSPQETIAINIEVGDTSTVGATVEKEEESWQKEPQKATATPSSSPQTTPKTK